jgi:hypothetical protein
VRVDALRRKPRTFSKLVYEIHYQQADYKVEAITPAGKQALHTPNTSTSSSAAFSLS